MTEAALIIRAAGPDDCRFYWTVNNDPTTRAVSMSTAPIPWASHATWYPARLSDPFTHLYVAEHGDVPVGVVRFDVEGEDATISVALAPEHQGKGLGRRIIAQATERTLLETSASRAVALIRPDNHGSVRAFVAAGYREDGSVVLGDHTMLRFIATT